MIVLSLNLRSLSGSEAFLDTLVKRAPAFWKLAVGCYMNVPTIPSRPANEISSGAGSLGFMLKLGFKADEFNKFTEGDEFIASFPIFLVRNILANCNAVMKVRCRSRAARILRRLQGRLVEQLSQADQRVIDDRFQQMVAHRIWPPRQILLDVLNKIAIRFLGNGAPPRLYQHVIIWNTDREDHHRESRKFLELGRALQCAPKEMFDTRDWAIMLLWDEMPRGIPGLARWRDAAGLGCVKLICRDHVFSIERTAMV